MQDGGEIDPESIRPLLRKPYFVPAGTSLLTQLTQFQADRQRIGLVVDEYGELKGLVTIEDIVEEIIGEFTTTAPDAGEGFRREADGSVIVDGMASLRDDQPAAGNPLPARRPEDAERPDRRPPGRHPRRGRRVPAGGAVGRDRPDAGPGGKGGEAAAAGGPAGRAFTKPGRAGIIFSLIFMDLE